MASRSNRRLSLSIFGLALFSYVALYYRAMRLYGLLQAEQLQPPPAPAPPDLEPLDRWDMELEHEPPPSPPHSPYKVYVYPNPRMAAGIRSRTTYLSGEPLIPPHGFMTGPHMASHLLYGALTTAEYATSNPAEADLFFAFVTPHKPPFHALDAADRRLMKSFGPDRIDYLPAQSRMSLVMQCRALLNRAANSTSIWDTLTHLTPSTRSRHMVVPETPWGVCYNEPEFKGVQLPIAHEELLLNALPQDMQPSTSPRTVHIPFPSSVRWSAELEATQPERAPWRGQSNRTVFMSFVGSTRGSAQAVALRQLIARMCETVSDDVCTALVTDKWPGTSQIQQGAIIGDEEKEHLRTALQVKRRSTFCLEPPGFAPNRKSMVDSLLSGCIPVFFWGLNDYIYYMDDHFGEWKREASVNLEPNNVLKKGEAALLQTLHAIPKSRIEKMQSALAEHAIKLVWGLGYLQGDAVETLLKVLLAKATAENAERRLRRRLSSQM